MYLYQRRLGWDKIDCHRFQANMMSVYWYEQPQKNTQLDIYYHLKHVALLTSSNKYSQERERKREEKKLSKKKIIILLTNSGLSAKI